MKIELTPVEARVIGCLLEKQVTTPDQYPLSLNALTNACNQKSNRDPLLSLNESTVQDTVDALKKRHLVMEKSGFGSRVPKYHQIFCNTEFGTLKLTPIETGILCELLLRGPQTPGELRARVARMAAVSDVSEIEQALDGMQTRAAGALVAKLPREPNRRDSRFAQLFTDPPAESASVAIDPEPQHVQARVEQVGVIATAADSAPTQNSGLTLQSLSARITALEAELADLRARLPN